MKTSPPFPSRQSLILALELSPIDEAAATDGAWAQTISFVEDSLGGDGSGLDQWVVTMGRQVYKVVPIAPRVSALFRELSPLVFLQAVLSDRGVLVRGIFTLGAVGVSSIKSLVGSGVTRAEELLRELGDAPRVVIDPQLLHAVEETEDLRAPHHSVPEELAYIKKLLRRDSDGQWFIDYALAVRSELPDSTSYPEYLEGLGDFIKRGLSENNDLGSGARRWSWLWHYYTRILDDLREAGIMHASDLARLRITPPSGLIYTFPGSVRLPTQ